MRKIKLSNIKTIIVMLLILIGIVILGSVLQTKRITSFCDNDANRISRIDIMNGNNGEIISVDNKDIIKDISTYLSKLKLKKVVLPASTGWTYRLSVIENGKEVLNMTFNGDEYCKINDVKYKIKRSTDVSIYQLYDKAKELE